MAVGELLGETVRLGNRSAGWTALVLVICLFASGAGAQTVEPLRLFTHNLHAEETHLDGFVDNLREADADIVTLQEVSPEAAQRFSEELDETYPYRAESLEFGRYNGLLVLSRYPVLDSQWWESMRLLRVDLDVDGAAVTVFNVHPRSPGNDGFEARDDDVAFALEQAAGADGPALLMGDFNLEPWAEMYEQITQTYADAFAAAGEGFGFTYPDYSKPQARVNARLPARTPLVVRLDYVFASDHFEVLEARVWPDSGGSDHRPVLAVVELK